MIEFDYREERLHSGEIIFRPVAKIYLLRKNQDWIAEYCYVDSGADYTLIPYRIGRFLGFENSASDEIKDIGGIGGAIGVRFTDIKMKISSYEFLCKIAWAQSDRVRFLLGRENVFENFEITFRQKERKTIFIWTGSKSA